jgi:hypothetical protein
MANGERIGHGPELYNAVQRLILEWRGCDETVRTASIPELVRNIVNLTEGHTTQVASAAATDTAEAA